MKKTITDQEASLLKSSHQIRVRFNEVDSLNIVWHGHYIKYFEDGREAFGREFGLTYLDAKNHGFATPIVKTSLEHQLPLRYGEVATIETTYINSRAAKLMFSYIIKNDQGQTVCTGETTQVFTNFESSNMALNLPDFYKVWKQKHGLLHA
ncbi:acyl-CoA thioester hydrolase [Gelidibacter algens]|uniref:Acyl-CoA thioester hydrolase n=1 Tax=Gelidibacter algens TaxID=49280 RepID=A0A1A7R5B8_9FLAO|nr:acyl-CoA thioesterase [Gelidibacter algens]OBX26664.1 4-hydroxybenzoyl-CoA thioesterase [Gelidibacter algens]RAJ25721.1 acyl-CoA thioester hydrolase [Gelidibacter algens]